MNWIRKWNVPSRSNSNLEYVVSLSDDNQWRCSCPVWKYKRKICKHIQEISYLSASCTPQKISQDEFILEHEMQL